MTVTFNENGFALKRGKVTVYVADNQGIYSHTDIEMVSEGGSLAAGSYLDAPPQAKAGFVIMRQENIWSYVADNRGTYYNTETGEQVAHTELGELPQHLTKIKPLAEPCKWDGEKWIVDVDKCALLLTEQRAQICEQINALKAEKTKGGVLLGEHWFDTDEEAQINIMGAYNGMLLAGVNSRLWTTYDNQVVTLTLDEMKALYLAVLGVKDHNHQTAALHKAAVQQSDSPLDYDYTSGWSKTYSEREKE